MNNIEYKKINCIFSLNSCIEEKIKEIRFNEESLLYINKLKKEYDEKVRKKILLSCNNGVEAKKRLLITFRDSLPSSLLIIRNIIKNILYLNDEKEIVSRVNKNLNDEINKLKYIR